MSANSTTQPLVEEIVETVDYLQLVDLKGDRENKECVTVEVSGTLSVSF